MHLMRCRGISRQVSKPIWQHFHPSDTPHPRASLSDLPLIYGTRLTVSDLVNNDNRPGDRIMLDGHLQLPRCPVEYVCHESNT